MNERDREALDDVLDFAERAARIAGARTLAAFVGDEAALYAVRYCLQVIGEAAARLSPAVQAMAPEVPWRDIVRMRHRLVHGYAAVTDAIVYDTVREDLPLLIRAVRSIPDRD